MQKLDRVKESSTDKNFLLKGGKVSSRLSKFKKSEGKVWTFKMFLNEPCERNCQMCLEGSPGRETRGPPAKPGGCLEYEKNHIVKNPCFFRIIKVLTTRPLRVRKVPSSGLVSFFFFFFFRSPFFKRRPPKWVEGGRANGPAVRRRPGLL